MGGSQDSDIDLYDQMVNFGKEWGKTTVCTLNNGRVAKWVNGLHDDFIDFSPGLLLTKPLNIIAAVILKVGGGGALPNSFNLKRPLHFINKAPLP
jgi:hypothetical protein